MAPTGIVRSVVCLAVVALAAFGCGDDEPTDADGGTHSPEAGHDAEAGSGAGHSGNAGRSGDAGRSGGAAGSAGAAGAHATQGGQGGHAGNAASSDTDSGADELDSSVPDDAGGEPGSPDGTYHCRGKQLAGDSCSEPLVDSAFSIPDDWTLEVMGGHLTITSGGFDQASFSCDGTWSDAEFAGVASWTRAGRECSSTFHLRVEADGTLTFWINALVDAQAGCHK